MSINNQDHSNGVDLACCSPRRQDQEESSEADVTSCCTSPADNIVASDAMDDIAQAAATSPEVDALRSTGFRLLLDHGRPVDVEHWATESGIDIATLNEIIETSGAKGRVQFDAEGRLVGIAGLTVEPTRHELNVEGTARWAWCALDAVGILGALEATGTIRSTDPHTGATIAIDFVRGEPDDEATLFILGGYDGGNVVEDWCPLVNFFATTLDAQEWVTAEGLDGAIVSVSSVASQAAEMWRPVVGDPTPQAHRHGESTLAQQRTEGVLQHGH
jgi:hypothetical protein